MNYSSHVGLCWSRGRFSWPLICDLHNMRGVCYGIYLTVCKQAYVLAYLQNERDKLNLAVMRSFLQG